MVIMLRLAAVGLYGVLAVEAATALRFRDSASESPREPVSSLFTSYHSTISKRKTSRNGDDAGVNALFLVVGAQLTASSRPLMMEAVAARIKCLTL